MNKVFDLNNRIKVKMFIPEGKNKKEVFVIAHGFGSSKEGNSAEIIIS